MVHERRIEGSDEILKLKVSGKVRLGNLIMYDEKTGSEWLQETGRSLSGELKGNRLPRLKAELWKGGVRWDQWKKMHPDSKVLHCDHCAGLRGG